MQYHEQSTNFSISPLVLLRVYETDFAFILNACATLDIFHPKLIQIQGEGHCMIRSINMDLLKYIILRLYALSCRVRNNIERKLLEPGCP